MSRTLAIKQWIGVLGIAVILFQGEVLYANEFDCLIEPNVVVNVGSDVEGVLKQITVDRGDIVQKGQMLAELDTTLQELALRSAQVRSENESVIQTNQARVNFGKRRLARTKELFESEISSLSELDEAETAKLLADLALIEAREAKRLAEFDLSRAWAELEMRTIQSPITGVVVERFLSPGELVSRTPIVKLAQLDPLRVEVFVPTSMLGKVQVGMVAEVEPEDPVGGRYSATVTVVDQIVDTASGTFGIRLRLPNPEYLLQAGLKCRMRFLLQ